MKRITKQEWVINTNKILDRVGTRILRDPYTSKPNVLFYATKRVGGLLEDSQAVKVLEVQAV